MKKGCLWFCFVIFMLFILIGACSDDDVNKDDKSQVSEENKKQNDDKQKKDEKAHKEKSEKKETDKKEKTNYTKKDSKDEKKEVENATQDSNKEEKKTFTPGTTDRIPVELSSTVDGDTAKFIYNGKEGSFRFLLIDTPETKHPRIGKQPFGQEASDRTKSLLMNANKIEVEFDVGEKQDKYQRYLAYIYIDGEMVNEILVREGLAKVAYVYPPNTRYLDRLESAQAVAKEQKLGIWSLDSAFEEVNNTEANTNSNTSNNNTTTNVPASQPETQQSQSKEFYKNCTELRKVYPNGVPSTHPAYLPKLDRDKDNFACEAN